MVRLRTLIPMFFTLTSVCSLFIFYLIVVTKHPMKKPAKPKLLTNFTYPMHGNVKEYVKELENGVTPSVTPYDQHDYHFKIINRNKCDNSSNSSFAVNSSLPISVVCLVKSAVDHFKNRKVIRNTWGSEKQFDSVKIHTVFLLGSTANQSVQVNVEEEGAKFQDILQGDFIDQYYNNTIKTLMALQWATKFCRKSKFYFFVDDDYLVSIENLLVFLLNPTAYPTDYTDKNLTNLLSNNDNRTQIQLNTTGTCRISVVSPLIYS